MPLIHLYLRSFSLGIPTKSQRVRQAHESHRFTNGSFTADTDVGPENVLPSTEKCTLCSTTHRASIQADPNTRHLCPFVASSFNHHEKVHLADKQVAASWHDVMSPPPVSGIDKPPTAGKGAPRLASAPANTSVPGTATAVVKEIAAVTAGEGFTHVDATDLTLILQEVNHIAALGRNAVPPGPDSKSLGSSRGVGNSGGLSVGSAVSVGSGGLSSVMKPRAPLRDAVEGSSPLHVKPGLAARKVLRTLRMHVTSLRVKKDNEASAEL